MASTSTERPPSRRSRAAKEEEAEETERQRLCTAAGSLSSVPKAEVRASWAQEEGRAALAGAHQLCGARRLAAWRELAAAGFEAAGAVLRRRGRAGRG